MYLKKQALPTSLSVSYLNQSFSLGKFSKFASPENSITSEQALELFCQILSDRDSGKVYPLTRHCSEAGLYTYSSDSKSTEGRLKELTALCDHLQKLSDQKECLFSKVSEENPYIKSLREHGYEPLDPKDVQCLEDYFWGYQLVFFITDGEQAK